MSQEYTEDKHIRFKKLSTGRRLLEAILLAIALGAIFLIVALVSFNPSDPSWSQTTWNEPVKNLAGSIGSWSADILFSAFGMLALLFLHCLFSDAGGSIIPKANSVMLIFSHFPCVLLGH